MERWSAVRKIPSWLRKRQELPTDREMAIAATIDRAVRPLFPAGFESTSQVVIGMMHLLLV